MTSTENPDISVVEGWGQQKGLKILELPSGSRVQIKEVDVPELIKLGALDLVDTFTQEALPEDQSKKKKKKIQDNFAEDISKNKEKMSTMIDVVDRIVVASIVKPKVHFLEEGAEPEEGKYYVNFVAFEDKIFIFEKAVASLGDFLADSSGQTENVADLADVKNVELPSE